MALPDKPPFTAPCNHCGLCCRVQLCPLAEIAYPDTPAPCPALDTRGDVALCSMVVTEEMLQLEPLIREALGIGAGCSMPDDGTTQAEIEQFDRVSVIRMHGPQHGPLD